MTKTLATLSLLLAAAAWADPQADILAGAGQLRASRAGRQAPKPPVDCGRKEGTRSDPAYKKECVCRGKHFVRTVFYKQTDDPLLPSAASNGLPDLQIRPWIESAETALNFHGLSLGFTQLPQGQDYVRPFGPAAFVRLRATLEIAGRPRDKSAEPELLSAPDERCKVIADGLRRRAPSSGELPIFFLNYGDGLKKLNSADDADVVGVTYNGADFESECQRAGESVPATPPLLIIVQANPDGRVPQVLIHEMGHAIGKATATPWFGDRYPSPSDPDVRNIMASKKKLASVDDMLMTDVQVEALCRAPYVSATDL